MMNNTKNKTISIIELTTECNGLFHQTLNYVKHHDFLQAQQCLNKGNELLLKASQIHALLLLEVKEVDLLLVYAEDLLISVQLYKSMIKEVIDVYKHFLPLEEINSL